MNDNKPRVLVIEDEAAMRELYVELLTDAGYEVDSARDGEEGLKKLQAGGWNLTLLDIVLPKIDGLTVLKLLQQQPPAQTNGPIVLITALAQETLVHDGLNSGASGYLIKSEINPDQVLSEVKNFLEKE